MHTYIALIRGINIGRQTALSMDELVAILKRLGMKNIQTYIQSGNAIFQCKNNLKSTFSENISSSIENSRGFRPSVILLSFAELEGAIKANPFNTADGKLLHFFFMKDTNQSADLKNLSAIKLPSEEFRLIKNVFYLYTPDGFRYSKVARKIEKAMNVPVTARNWNTVKKIQEMIDNQAHNKASSADAKSRAAD